MKNNFWIILGMGFVVLVAYAAGDLVVDKASYDLNEAVMYNNSHSGDCGGCSNTTNYITAFDINSGSQLCATTGVHNISDSYNLDSECKTGGIFPSSTESDYAILGIYPGAGICKGDVGVSDYTDCLAQSYDEAQFVIVASTSSPPSSTTSSVAMVLGLSDYGGLGVWLMMLMFGVLFGALFGGVYRVVSPLIRSKGREGKRLLFTKQ